MSSNPFANLVDCEKHALNTMTIEDEMRRIELGEILERVFQMTLNASSRTENLVKYDKKCYVFIGDSEASDESMSLQQLLTLENIDEVCYFIEGGCLKSE